MQNSTLENAIAAHREGNYSVAEAAYRAVLAQEPANAAALHLLGVLLHQRGESAAAVELISRAIALRADVAAYHSNLAEAYRVLQRLEEAENAIQKAIALRPDYAEAYHNRGLILLRMGRIEEAVASFNHSLSLQPKRATTLATKADALRLAGQVAAAVEAYRELRDWPTGLEPVPVRFEVHRWYFCWWRSPQDSRISIIVRINIALVVPRAGGHNMIR